LSRLEKVVSGVVWDRWFYGLLAAIKNSISFYYLKLEKRNKNSVFYHWQKKKKQFFCLIKISQKKRVLTQYFGQQLIQQCRLFEPVSYTKFNRLFSN
jgi:hypothetical protein